MKHTHALAVKNSIFWSYVKATSRAAEREKVVFSKIVKPDCFLEVLHSVFILRCYWLFLVGPDVNTDQFSFPNCERTIPQGTGLGLKMLW